MSVWRRLAPWRFGMGWKPGMGWVGTGLRGVRAVPRQRHGMVAVTVSYGCPRALSLVWVTVHLAGGRL